MEVFQQALLLTEAHRFRDLCPWYAAVIHAHEWSVSSLYRLLQIENAPEYLLSLNVKFPNSILWLSDNVCLHGLEFARMHQSSIKRLFSLNIKTSDHPHLSLLLSMKVYPSSSKEMDGKEKSSSPSSFPAAADANAVDMLFHLLARHKSIEFVSIVSIRDTVDPPVSLSLRALKVLVGEASSPRHVAFKRFRFSREQCLALAFGCHNDKVMLDVCLRDWSDAGAALIQALIRNESPTKLALSGFERSALTEEAFHALLIALELNTSLRELRIGSVGDRDRFRKLINAIGRNRGLLKLDMNGLPNAVMASQWEHVWNSLSSHPTLMSINIKGCWRRRDGRHRGVGFMSESSLENHHNIMLARIMARSLRRNTVLTELKYDKSDHRCNQILEKQILPILELNRFHLRLKAIKQEKLQTLREFLFTSTLHDQKVCIRPSLIFVLLKENVDLWVPYL